MIVTQSHCDYAFAVARHARCMGLTKEQLVDLLNAAFTVLEQNVKRVDELDQQPCVTEKCEMISEERLRNTRAWAAARPDMSGSEVIVGAIDELLELRAAAQQFGVLEERAACEAVCVAISERTGISDDYAAAAEQCATEIRERLPVNQVTQQSDAHPEFAELRRRAEANLKAGLSMHGVDAEQILALLDRAQSNRVPQQGVVPYQYIVMREMFQPGVTYWICQHRKSPAPSRCELCTPFNQGEQPR